jgi:hypothetical protein
MHAMAIIGIVVVSLVVLVVVVTAVALLQDFFRYMRIRSM